MPGVTMVIMFLTSGCKAARKKDYLPCINTLLVLVIFLPIIHFRYYSLVHICQAYFFRVKVFEIENLFRKKNKEINCNLCAKY